MKNYFDSINRIYNTYNSGKKISFCKYSIFTIFLFIILIDNNYIENFFILLIKKKKYIIVFIKNIYYVKFVSKPSKKIYIKNKFLKKIFFNISLGIISTNLGLLTIKECQKIGVGGYLLIFII